MKKYILVSVLTLFTAQSFAATQTATATQIRPKDCAVNPDIERNARPSTPHNMPLPQFGQGIIGWATGPEGAQHKLDSVNKTDIQNYKSQGVSLAMIHEWQTFYENETKRNSCNPTAPIRAQLMQKIASLWN